MEVSEVSLLDRQVVEHVLQSVFQSASNLLVEEHPREAVAVVAFDNTAYEFTICPLINQRRNNHEYMVSERLVKEELNRISARGWTPVAWYHSHPNSSSEPSPADVWQMSEAENELFIIQGANFELAAYRHQAGETVRVGEFNV